LCHADGGLCERVLKHLRQEEALRPDAVFAEIVHVPEDRVANVLSRPLLRPYEIPCLTRSGARPENQIPLSDLYVSVQAGRVVLSSATLKREVLPRLTTAHNYHRPCLGLYRFLCMLQDQGVAVECAWNWGALSSAPFLPRVVTGRIVLSPARWRVYEDELNRFRRITGHTLFETVQAWRTERRIPALVSLAAYDNALPIDFRNPLSVDSFLDLVEAHHGANLVELFPTPEELCAQTPDGRFTHDLIVPFIRCDAVEPAIPQDLPARSRRGAQQCPRVFRRSFAPGSEWLYAKLYTGTATSETVLREVVRPLTRRAGRSGVVKRWFYVRYNDPEFHLRVRLQGAPRELHARVLPHLESLVKPLLTNGSIWRFQVDTYEREVERYGGPEGVVLAERLFHLDSEAALSVIERLKAMDAGPDERWQLAASGIEMVLTRLGLGLSGKHDLMKRGRNAAIGTQVIDRLQERMAYAFRAMRKTLGLLLEPKHHRTSALWPIINFMWRRSEGVARILAEVRTCEQTGGLGVSFDDFVLDVFHMQLNRLLRSAHREQEVFILDVLARRYRSCIAASLQPHA